MPELIIITVAFLLLILIAIWWHFIKQNEPSTIINNSQRDDTNVRLYHEHKAEIENDFKQNRIDDENYQYLMAELDKSLLQDIEENKKFSKNDVIESKNLSIIWPMTLTTFILAFSFFIYNYNGAYQQLSQPLNQVNQQGSAQVNQKEQAKQIIDEIKAIIDLTVKEPKNTDAWYSLGQAFVSIGEFNRALESFDQVINIEGESAELYGAKAQAYYYKDKQIITTEVQKFIDKALVLDPKDPSTNILIGMHNFMNENYQVAIKHWEMVINSGKSNVNTEALSEAVIEAKNRLSTTHKDENITPSSATDSGPQLTVNVAVSEKIQQQLIQGEDKVVFVYAVSSDGKHGKMPVAAVKMKASDLPVSIVLNNSKAMSPQAKIGDVSAVNIYVVVSASGAVGVKSGDYKAEILNADVLSTTPLSLLIDTVVP